MENGKDRKNRPEAFEAAVKYLAASPRSEREVRDKLRSKGYRVAETEEAIDRAKEYRYVDDEAYVRDFFEYYGGKYGRKRLIYKLTAEKGVSQELALRAADEYLSDEKELEKAVSFASRYVASKRIVNKKDFAKVSAFLYQKGFENSVISKAVSSLYDGASDDDDPTE